MRAILVFPPQWTPLNPHFSLASLYSQLVNNGFDVSVRDLNIEFYNEILNKNYLKNCLKNSLSNKDKLFKELAAEYDKYGDVQDYPDSFKKKLAKYTKINETTGSKLQQYEKAINSIEEAVSTMRDKEKFYNPTSLIYALNIIDTALEVASLPYTPAALHLHDYSNPFFKLTFESIKENCLDKSVNMFYTFYKRIIPELLADNPDFVAISLNSSSQIIPGLTLAMLLKQQKKCHVSIGGNFWGRVVDSLVDCPEFFELFADSISVEEGEGPIVKFASHFEGKLIMDEVPNVIHLKDRKVVCNSIAAPMKLDEIYPQNLKSHPLDLYLTPDIVLSIQSSKGCYWGKCSFCDQDFGQNSCIKDVNILINELKYLNETFNISHFEFIDESISPAYMEKMSNKILEEGLNINWFCDARLEKEFTPDILEKARKAGLRMTLWGFESGSDRIMKMINKGIDISRRFEILKNARNANIWNFAFIFFGFPSETKEDALKTIQTISDNTNLINSYGRSIFTLGKHTNLRENPEKFHITKIFENSEEFSPSYTFETSEGMNSAEISEMAKLCTQMCNEAYGNPLWMHLRYREILFLYIAKYGVNVIANTKI